MRGPAMVAGVAWLASAGCGRIGFEPAPVFDRDGGADDAAIDAFVPAGAVLYLPFSEPPAGTSVVDLAGAHTVTCTPQCPAPIAGIRGNAYHFDSSGPDMLTATYASDLDASGGFTIALWIRIATLPPPPYYCLLMKPVGTGTSDSYGLCVDSVGVVLFHSGTVAGTDNLLMGGVALGTWHHVAMSWDGTTKRGYFDGAIVASRAVPIGNDASAVVVGADLNGGSIAYPLDGDLDEVLVFDRVLAAADIAALAQ